MLRKIIENMWVPHIVFIVRCVYFSGNSLKLMI